MAPVSLAGGNPHDKRPPAATDAVHERRKSSQTEEHFSFGIRKKGSTGETVTFKPAEEDGFQIGAGQGGP